MQTLEVEPERVSDGVPGRRAAWITGGVSGVATLAWLLLGSGRAYDLDDSLTVGIFVATPSVGDAFTKAYVLNNHVFFSFMDHLVYSATGSKAELTMRLLPTLFAAVAVGLLAGLLTRRWGWIAGAGGAAALATNPMFSDVGSQVRGYSFVVLLTVATTAILLRALERDDTSPYWRAAYAVLAALGVATHLYMLVVVGVHVIVGLSNRRVWRAWIPAWLASLIGLVAFAYIWREMRETADSLGRRFRGGFPLDLGVALLGGSIIAALIMLAIVGPVVWRARHSTIVRLGALGIVVAVTAIWLIGPFDLYPRFFLWLVPLPAVGIAAAIRHRRATVWAVLVLVLVQLWVAWPRVTENPYASRTVRDVFARVAAAGKIPCTIDGFATIRLTAYTKDFAVAGNKKALGACEVAVLLAPAGSPTPQSVRDANASFPHRTTLPARSDATLWSREPTGCWLSASPPDSLGCAGAAG